MVESLTLRSLAIFLELQEHAMASVQMRSERPKKNSFPFIGLKNVLDRLLNTFLRKCKKGKEL